MRRSDYHTHTPLCQHASGTPAEFVAEALRMGLSAYGISDHAPMAPELEPYDDWRMLYEQLPEYMEWIQQARQAAQGTNLLILAGLECDWIPGIEPWIQHLQSVYSWDYLIGSVHYLRNKDAVDDSVYANKTVTQSVDGDWEQYAFNIQSLIESGLFDVVGHMDLVKIWGRLPQQNALNFYCPILDTLKDSGMAVEMNTAGWHKPCAEQYPSIPLLRELLKRRIPILINADAHSPGHLSRDWDKGVALLRSLTNDRLVQLEHPVAHGKTTLLAYGSF